MSKNPAFVHESNTVPPRLPYVLLCHSSGARCGFTVTVNTPDKWRAALALRQAHEDLCITKPAASLIVP
jgi:hypothetical protein